MGVGLEKSAKDVGVATGGEVVVDVVRSGRLGDTA
jgi:hypothetical protein